MWSGVLTRIVRVVFSFNRGWNARTRSSEQAVPRRCEGSGLNGVASVWCVPSDSVSRARCLTLGTAERREMQSNHVWRYSPFSQVNPGFHLVANIVNKSWSRMSNLDLSCLVCGVWKSIFTDCRDTSTLSYIGISLCASCPNSHQFPPQILKLPMKSNHTRCYQR